MYLSMFSKYTMITVLLVDPMGVITMHLFCGMYSCIMEGIIANDVYGSPGLIWGGYRHFIVQLVGTIVICIFNFILCLFLWDIVMKRLIFRNTDIRVSILDIYLGTRLFDQNYNMALEEVLLCESNRAKNMLWQFHQYVDDMFASEQLNFMIVIKIFNAYLQNENVISSITRKYISQIIDTYIDKDGVESVNISSTERSLLLRIKKKLLTESNESKLDIITENMFKDSYSEIMRLTVRLFRQFLTYSYKKELKCKFDIEIPFKLNDNWTIKWDDTLTKQTNNKQLIHVIPPYNINSKILVKPDMSSEIQMQHILSDIDHETKIDNEYQRLHSTSPSDTEKQTVDSVNII